MIYVGNYELDYLDKDLYTVEELITIIEDLHYENKHYEEEIQRLRTPQTNEDYEYDAYRESLLGC